MKIEFPATPTFSVLKEVFGMKILYYELFLSKI